MTAPTLPPITRVGILAKSQLHEAASHLVDIAQWLEQRGIEAVFETETAGLMPPGTARRVAAKNAIAREAGMVLILGGDGTLLAMADCIGEAGSDIPILGVNFGSLGFLTEVTLPELYTSLETALSGHARIEERVMLQCAIRRGGALIARHIALNDAVVTKAARARMVDLSVWLGDDFVTRVEHQPEGHQDRGERAGGERDVGRLERQAQLSPRVLGEEALRVFLGRLVREPVLVVRDRVFTDRRHQARQGHLVRVSEREVADAGLETRVGVTRGEEEVLDGGEGRVG